MTQHTPLFRPEVLVAQREATPGTILMTTPLSRWLSSLLLAVSFGAAIVLFLLSSHYTRRESVTGLFNVTTPNAAGTITQLHVHDSQTEPEAVNAGMALDADIRQAA